MEDDMGEKKKAMKRNAIQDSGKDEKLIEDSTYLLKSAVQ